MKKITCVLFLSVILTLAHSSNVDDFEKASREWISANSELAETSRQHLIVADYFQRISGNDTCSDAMSDLFDDELLKAATEWEADKSRIGSIVSNLYNAVYPSLILKLKDCADPKTFKADVDKFTSNVDYQTKFISSLRDAYKDFVDEVEFLTKNLTVDEACVQNFTTQFELFRLYGVVQFLDRRDLLTMMVKAQYLEKTKFVRKAQRCLTGSADKNFESALSHYFDKFPVLKEMHTRSTYSINGLKYTIKSLECSGELESMLAASRKDAIKRFASGDATISELVDQFLQQDLPKGLEYGKKCLSLVRE